MASTTASTVEPLVEAVSLTEKKVEAVEAVCPIPLNIFNLVKFLTTHKLKKGVKASKSEYNEACLVDLVKLVDFARKHLVGFGVLFCGLSSTQWLNLRIFKLGRSQMRLLRSVQGEKLFIPRH